MSTGFHQLLSRLDPDTACAGARFAWLRRKLLEYLAWRGVACPEDLADETIGRLARKLEEGVEVVDLAAFACAIARRVLLESRRDSLRRASLDGVEPCVAAGPETPDAELLSARLERCLSALPRESRAFLLAYYSGGDGARKIAARRRLAVSLGVPPSTLRSRAQRLRERIAEDLRGNRRGEASFSGTFPPFPPLQAGKASG